MIYVNYYYLLNFEYFFPKTKREYLVSSNLINFAFVLFTLSLPVKSTKYKYELVIKCSLFVLSSNLFSLYAINARETE